jgi:serine O-acetyltransferase
MVLFLHRIAHRLAGLGTLLPPRLIYALNRILFSVVLPGYSGLGTVIHARAVIGDRVSIGTNVTIGGRSGHQDVPRIEDDVEIGSGAKILGPVVIGARSKIGANSVVLKSVPSDSVVVGIPGRVVSTAGVRTDEVRT